MDKGIERGQSFLDRAAESMRSSTASARAPAKVTYQPVDQAALSDDGRKLAGALALIPRNAKHDRHTAECVIGWALRHSTSGLEEDEGTTLCAEWDKLTGGASLTIFKTSDPEYCATKPVTIASVFDLAKTHGWKGEQESTDNSVDPHRNAPKPDATMLYGLIGDVARAAAQTTEANRYAVAAAHIALLSAGVGRNVYLPVGNVKHHARIFMLHVGRSGRGRKGEAVSLTKRIRGKIERQHSADTGTVADPFCGQMHDGGLSSREGLALLIHDGYRVGKEDVLPIEDKRLWIIESEFANVLHQAKRDGNTLSAALRDSWDGVSIRPATKTSRLWASHPHLSLTGNITPSELLGLMESRELSNGFANRFLIFWAERERIEPFPKPTPTTVVTDLAERTKDVIRFATEGYPENRDSRPMELSADARTEYARLYRGELSRLTDGEKVAALIERRAPMLLRLAMIFALTDKTLMIELPHIHAALAWVRFHRDSVRFIFNDAAGELAARESSDGAAKILEYLTQNGRTSRAELSKKCFSGHLSAKRIDEALDSLLMNTPPSIEVQEGEKDEKSGKRTKFYHCCETGETGETGEVAHSTRNGASSRSCETGEVGIAAKNPVSPSSPISQACESAGKPIDRPSSPVSPSSRPAMETPVDLVEIEI
jgi:putative DNA primase/helicase